MSTHPSSNPLDLSPLEKFVERHPLVIQGMWYKMGPPLQWKQFQLREWKENKEGVGGHSSWGWINHHDELWQMLTYLGSDDLHWAGAETLTRASFERWIHFHAETHPDLYQKYKAVKYEEWIRPYDVLSCNNRKLHLSIHTYVDQELEKVHDQIAEADPEWWLKHHYPLCWRMLNMMPQDWVDQKIFTSNRLETMKRYLNSSLRRRQPLPYAQNNGVVAIFSYET
jgi:hypothetical protein